MHHPSPVFRHSLGFAVLLTVLAVALPARAIDDYTLGPDSQVQPGVPHGEVTQYTWNHSKIFPGTVHDYWVYVPKQVDPSHPACVMVFQDGGGFQGSNGQFRVPVVFDNLIAKKEMPVTVAIMIDPGVVPAAGPNTLPRYNRSHEYDAPTDQYARFLLEEILPEVGKKVNLTQDPAGRALCGASSGGICSFVAAWERPDQFSKVISFVGSFTDLQGGHNIPTWIRKMEPRPIRVFMQDGSHDQDIYGGSWFLGNQEVAAALQFAGYDMKFVVGDGGHNGRQGGAILPDALRWLWRDYPAPLHPGAGSRQPVMNILLPDESWQKVGGDYKSADALATDAAGNVYFADNQSRRIDRIDTAGNVTVFKENTGSVGALAVAPDGTLLAGQSDRKRLVAFDAAGKESVLARGVTASDLAVNHSGEIYLTDASTGKVWLLAPHGQRSAVDTGFLDADGIVLTPDQSLLLVAQGAPGKFVTSYQVRPDGTLTNKQPYFDLQIPYGLADSGAAGMTVDTGGWLYVASRAGVQICDEAGRVNGIIAPPDRLDPTHVVFGGPSLDEIYVTAGGSVYRRKTKAKGVLSFNAPILPPAPRL